MTKVTIFKPTKSAMTSGKRNTKEWVLTFEQEGDARFVEPLMGWTGSSDMTQEMRLEFDTVEAAEAYAKEQGFEYRVVEPQAGKRPIRAYSDNFTIAPAYEPLD